MCRVLFTDSSTWNYFTPPFPQSKTFQVCTGLDYGKNPSLEKHFIQVLQCLPQLKPLFLRLQNSFPYIKRWVNTSLWESHIRWSHSHSLMHIHPYIYLEIIPSEFKGGCMGQVKGRLDSVHILPPIPSLDRFNTHRSQASFWADLSSWPPQTAATLPPMAMLGHTFPSDSWGREQSHLPSPAPKNSF